MTTRRDIQVASLLVALEKQASLGAISKATSYLGRAARKAIGSGLIGTPLGLAAHGAIKAAPYGAAAYGANTLLGDPVGKQLSLQKARLRARAAQHRAVYDPRTGVMY